jgi:hypothetical protein
MSYSCDDDGDDDTNPLWLDDRGKKEKENEKKMK